MVQSSSPTPEQMDALIAEHQRIARKPPQTVPVDTQPPSKTDPEDSSHTLLPRKRKKEVIPSKGAPASGSSFEIPEPDISKG
uniref:Uncharacterized protein n=1 Tax=Lactuca sativa TaxID=4236 RepID=A0A9R1W728_LACSA|nr:hypothetical protein LSAT_V11C300137590 [Lactuca sativa]